MENPLPRAEAQRWMEVAGKLLEARDLPGSKRFAKRAQETDPHVDGVDQLIAIIDVLLAAEKRINNHLDWYAILQLDRRSNDLDVIKRQYRKLALLLHPDKNKSPLSGSAFKLVCDAWAFLSDPNKKILYDNEFNLFMKFDPVVLKSAAAKASQKKSEVRRSVRERRQTAKAAAAAKAAAEEAVKAPPPQEFYSRAEPVNSAAPSRLSTFWTVCPYCYYLYEYPRVYEECCVRCQKCRRGFHAVAVAAPPPSVEPGKDLYYCCWAFFPIGYTKPENLRKDSSWSPFASMFPAQSHPEGVQTDDRNSDKEDDLVDDRGGKKGRTENLDTNVSSSVNVEKGGNVESHTPTPVQDGLGGNNVVQQKTVRVKTTARKSVLPRPNNQTTAESQSKTSGAKSNPVWPGMDLNMEMKGDTEEVKEADVVVGVQIGSIDKEAKEGIGFFEGLDDLLGNLPILGVQAEKKAQDAS